MLKKNAFTIIELVVVISVLAIIVGVSIPSINGMKANATAVQVRHDLMTLQAALENYYTFNNSVYPTDLYTSGGTTTRSIQSEFLISAQPQMISNILNDPALSGGGDYGFGSEYFYGVSPNLKYYIIGSVGCFISGTKVLLADGREIPIENLKVGDVLLGSHGAHNKVLKRNEKPKQFWRLYAFNGGRYFVTENHVFKTKDGWKAIDPKEARKDNPQLHVEKLTIGDELVTKEGYLRLLKIESRIFKNAIVYNPALNGNHEYYADGYLVHNKVSNDMCPSSGFSMTISNTGYSIVMNTASLSFSCVTNFPSGGC